MAIVAFPRNEEQRQEHRKECMRIVAELEVMGYTIHHERIIILGDDPVGKSAGGIILPEQSKRKPSRGTIVAMGAGVNEDSGLGELSVLDRILFTKYNPILIELLDSSGNEMILEVMHTADIYVSWKGTGGKG